MISLLMVLGGFIYTNFLEWVFHRYLLHGLGKKKGSLWAFHLGHHRECFRYKNYDKDYKRIFDSQNFNELKSLGLVALLHLPLALVSFYFYLGAALGGVLYFVLHRKSHIDTKWGKKYMPWHYVHHMQKSNMNWCVTYPLFDKLLGTYLPYEEKNTHKSARNKSKPEDGVSGSSDHS